MSNRTITSSKTPLPLEGIATIPVYNETGMTNHKDTLPTISEDHSNEKEVPVYTANTVTLDVVKSHLPQNQYLENSIVDPSGREGVKNILAILGVLLAVFLLVGITIQAQLGVSERFIFLYVIIWSFFFFLPYLIVVLCRFLEASSILIKTGEELESCINEMTHGGYSAIKALESADTDKLIQDYIKSHKEVYAGIRTFNEELDAHIFVFFGSANHMIMVPSSNALRDLFSGKEVTGDDYETWRGFSLYVNFLNGHALIRKTGLEDDDNMNMKILDIAYWNIKGTPGFFRVWPVNNPDNTIMIKNTEQLEKMMARGCKVFAPE